MKIIPKTTQLFTLERPCASRYVSTCGDGCPIKGAQWWHCNCHLCLEKKMAAAGPGEACFATRWRWRGQICWWIRVGIGIFNSLWNVARFFNISTKKRTTRAPQAETCLVIGSCGYLENIPKHILVDFLKLGQSQQYFPCRKMAGLIHGAPWLRDRHTKYILCCKAGLSKVGC